MTRQGKKIRMERIIDRITRRTVIVPMDHGVSIGPIQGLEDLSKATQLVADGGANAVLGHRGLALYGHRGYGTDIGLIIHLSGSSMLAPDPNNKVQLMKVEDAIKYGADAVSIHINVGADNEAEMFSMLGNVSEVCMEWGFPLIAMMYPRGQKVTNEHDVEVVKLAARIGAELGADIVKTNYTGSPETFREVVDGCPVPVVIAGGPRMDSPRDVLEMLYDSISVGAAGASIGRNVFQAKDPTAMVRAMCEVVHREATVDEAMKLLK